jgi:hypothetical protein
MAVPVADLLASPGLSTLQLVADRKRKKKIVCRDMVIQPKILCKESHEYRRRR